jgi:two-component system CheB/CheR fusion protein
MQIHRIRNRGKRRVAVAPHPLLRLFHHSGEAGPTTLVRRSAACGELQTINEELRQRSDELNHVNTFLQSILASFRGGVVVVDQDLLVLIWNHKAENLWGLRADEVQGKNFLNLDIGLPVQQLKQPIRACLSGEQVPTDLVLKAVNRRGKPIHCRVNCAPLIGVGGETRGTILLMEETDGANTPPPP